MIDSTKKLTKKAVGAVFVLFLFANTVQAQNKDIILRASSSKDDCPQGALKFELPIAVKNDQQVTYKIIIKTGQGQNEYEGTGELKQGKVKYTLEPGMRGTFNGSITVEIVFPDKSVAKSNEVTVIQTQNPKSKCDWPQTGNQMAADPPPPPPMNEKVPIVGSLKAEYQLASKQSGRPCPANAAISGTIAMNEDGRETVYYRLVRWNAKSQTPLQPYYKVDLEKSTAPKGGGGASTARVGTQVNVLPSSVSITPSTWVVGETEPQFSEGVVQLWRVTPGPNGTFTYDGFLSAVNLSCGSSRGGSRGEPSKGGNSVIKPNRKPR